MDLDAEMTNFNKVKDLVLQKLVSEGLLDSEDAEEFSERCQVLTYKGKWFSKWFDKNVKVESNNENGFYMRIIEMNEKESDLDKLLRKTSSN